MKIPDSLLKYFNSPKGRKLLSSASDFSASDFVIDQILNEKNFKNETLTEKIPDQKPKYYKCTKENVLSSFSSYTWDNLKLEQKLRCAKVFIDKLLSDMDFDGTPPKLTIIDNSKYDDKVLGSFREQPNRLYLNLENFQSSSGIQILSILAHECFHAIDFNNFRKKELPELLSKYCGTEATANKVTISRLMELPIEGRILNLKTNKKEMISKDLANKILHAKNHFSVFQYKDSPDYLLTSLQNTHDLMDNFLYYYSPVERFARIKTRLYLNSILKDSNITKSSKDKVLLKLEVRKEDEIDKHISRCKTMLNMPHKQFLNLALENNFYELTNSLRSPFRTKTEKNNIENIMVQYDKSIRAAYSKACLERTLVSCKDK